MNRFSSVVSGLIVAACVAGVPVSAQAAPTENHQASHGVSAGDQGPTVEYDAAFQNASFVNNTNTPLHIVTKAYSRPSAVLTIEPGGKGDMGYEPFHSMTVYAGRDAQGPVWAQFGDMKTRVESMVPDARGYLWAEGSVVDPDTQQQSGFKIATGSTEKLELARKTFAVKFWQDVEPGFWIPHAQFTFGGQYEEQFPRESTVTVKNRSKGSSYSVAGQEIAYMQDTRFTTETPSTPRTIGRIDPVSSRATSYPPTAITLSAPPERTKPSSLTFSDPQSGHQYLNAQNLWGMQGKWFDRLEPRNGSTMTVKRETNLDGKAHFVVTIYNL